MNAHIGFSKLETQPEFKIFVPLVVLVSLHCCLLSYYFLAMIAHVHIFFVTVEKATRKDFVSPEKNTLMVC